jgi:hypothetical protein
VRLWDAQTNKPLRTLTGHTEEVKGGFWTFKYPVKGEPGPTNLPLPQGEGRGEGVAASKSPHPNPLPEGEGKEWVQQNQCGECREAGRWQCAGRDAGRGQSPRGRC